MVLLIIVNFRQSKDKKAEENLMEEA